jgi:dephospho-CoA kinase
MVVLGLTGSIGMGKSTAAQLLRRLGVPVHDADEAVHRLLGPGGRAVAPVEAAFPGVAGPSGIDRRKLGAIVFQDEAALRRLEAILHPLVRVEEDRFLRRMAALRRPVVVLDVPLLFEGGGEARCDAVIVVTAPAFLQRHRVLRRPGMSEERFRAILARQLPDVEKRRRADFIVDSGQGRTTTLRQLARIVRIARTANGRRWQRGQGQSHARNRARHRNHRSRPQ